VIVEATSKIIDYIINNKEKVISESIELPNSMLTTIMVEKYNQKYSTLDESEKQILKVLIESTDEQKKEVYGKVVRECIDLINEKLEGSDLETKDKLLRVKDRLLNDKQEINEDFIKNISKIIDLKNTLKEN
jgi:Tol biopolymer transport system component